MRELRPTRPISAMRLRTVNRSIVVPPIEARDCKVLLRPPTPAIADAGEDCDGADPGHWQQELFVLVVSSVDRAAGGRHPVRGGRDPALRARQQGADPQVLAGRQGAGS